MVEPLNALTEDIHVNTPNTNSDTACICVKVASIFADMKISVISYSLISVSASAPKIQYQ